MLRHSGKAAVEVGHAVHRVCGFLLTLMVILSVGAVGVAWRLSRGPVDLGFLKDRVEAAVNNGFGPIRVTIGGASIAWGGFSHGLDQPLILRFTDLRVEEAAGAARVQIPIAEATLSVRWLLLGRVLPRTITLEGARLVLIRAIDGSVSFGLDDAGDRTGPSPLDGLLAVLGTPAETDRQAGGGRLSQLSAISIRSARLSLSNRVLGLALTAERADVDFSRRRGGGMDGHATLLLAMGEQKSVLSAKFALAAGARSAHVAARLSQMTPKALATSAPILAPLAALDAPLSLDGEADLGPDFIPTNFRVIARAGAGKINTDTASIPIRRAEVIASGTLEQATLESAVVELRPTETAAISTLGGSGSVIRRAGRLAAMLRLTLDRVAFADLPTLWPADIGSNARAWIVQNIQAGTARDGRAEFVLEAPDDASDVTLLSASATLEGDDVAVTWLPTVPRVEQARAHVVLTDPDKVEIDVRSGRQRVNGGESIAVQNGHVTVTGLTKKDQFATIRCDATGSVPSTIALLKEPRLRILDRHPIDLRQPAGDVRVNLQVAVPLLLGLRFDDVTIHGAGTISKAHLSGIAAGRDLDDGMIGFDVDANRLTIKGTARLAGISSTIDGMMDFRAGPPSQVTQRYTVIAGVKARGPWPTRALTPAMFWPARLA